MAHCMPQTKAGRGLNNWPLKLNKLLLNVLNRLPILYGHSE